MLGTNCFAVISLRVGRYKVGLHWTPRKFHLCANYIQISDQIPFPLYDILSYQVALLAQLLVGLCCCGITFAHRSSAFQIASSFCSSTILMLIFGVAMGSAYEIASSICSSCSSWSYLIFVIFFTQAKFLENKIYTEIHTVNCQFFALNL